MRPPIASIWLNSANVVTFSRVLLVIPTLYGIHQHLAFVSVSFFALIVSSDFLDGALARKSRSINPLGTLFDHSADAAVVSAISAMFVQLSMVPVLLPIMIALSFVQYALDARKSDGFRPRPSALGKINGIAYFVFCAICIAYHHSQFVLLNEHNQIAEQVIKILAWILVCSTFASILQRLKLKNR
ncbi:MAG: CDP-alcohol phosphatidyltransferase family protein [Gammaproteobacteria bacterium]